MRRGYDAAHEIVSSGLCDDFCDHQSEEQQSEHDEVSIIVVSWRVECCEKSIAAQRE
jgi:hypothetical protein